MSTHGLQWFGEASTAEFETCITPGSVDVLANQWQADILRISMYPDESDYKSNKARYHASVDKIIDWATDQGLYVIIDWHMLTPGDPWLNIDHAKEYFDYMIAHHGDKKNVLYEISNEPNGEDVNWVNTPHDDGKIRNVRNYSAEMIAHIRAEAGNDDTIILVGTTHWSSFGLSTENGSVDDIINFPVLANRNIMYTFHFYAASHDPDYYLEALKDKVFDTLPVFVSEFGTQDYAGEGANDFDTTQVYLDEFKAKKISWVNWNYSSDIRSGAVFKQGVCAAQNWGGDDDTVLKEAGKWIKNKLRSEDDWGRNDNLIGVLTAEECPNSEGTLSILMDDENNFNGSYSQGWTGLSGTSNGDTHLKFCRVSSYQFKPLSGHGNDYAVLQLSDTCPAGTESFERYIDNQDHNNHNSVSGDVSPSLIDQNSSLRFCLYRGGSSNDTMGSFPDLGFDYGVFGRSSIPQILDSGLIISDDEDYYNANFHTGSQAARNIVSDGRDTLFNTAFVFQISDFPDTPSDYPAWQLNEHYSIGERVSHNGKNWEAIQEHTAFDPNWAPGPATLSLWKEV